ncbi:MAG: MogA/MoaB family molybdenum cofactor biosynthesis protein [Phycisphaerales bacterium]|nr:MogA/MoaB family molybdenum cofactor biosynthesis protein [Phycisphaerae bacterium]NNF42006.1 MogA/MoaB family molybdenum cofactor biosynthesis protein [Phycisphaerales bacterium]NNM24826.1 MogA/MoaB family molybdenum cofactor biosynthesis protein [Phycisphaerales bacterium]
MTEPPAAHRAHAADDDASRSIPCAVLTVSDTRTDETDVSGNAIVTRLAAAGHRLADRRIVRDEPDAIRTTIDAWLDDPDVAVVITTGGTGLGRRDGTVEVVRALLSAELEGFGELFRMISFQEIGSAAMLSRAVGGLVTRAGGGDTFLFALPGSPNAVATALDRLLVPELGHLVWMRRNP